MCVQFEWQKKRRQKIGRRKFGKPIAKYCQIDDKKIKPWLQGAVCAHQAKAEDILNFHIQTESTNGNK